MKEGWKRRCIMAALYGVVVFASLGMFMFLAKFLGFFGGIDASVTRMLSGPIEVGPAGVTFTQSPPLQLERESSKVLMRIDAVRDVDFSAGTLLLEDGTVRYVSVSLKDEAGKVYELSPISRGAALGFGFSDADREALSKENAFSSLSVKSDLPLSIRSIEWYSWTGK